MSNPSLLVYVSGTGAPPISADNLNTFIQGGGVFLANLRAFSGLTGMTVFMSGYAAPNDGGQGMFYWNATTGTDDGGVTTIVPTGSTGGCWSRLSNASVAYAPATVNNASGQTLTAANVTNQVLVRSGAVGVTDTFPSASAIIAALGAQQSGAIRDLLVINENTGSLVLASGSGVTFTGNLSGGNFSIPTVTQRLFKMYMASPTSIVVYG